MSSEIFVRSQQCSCSPCHHSLFSEHSKGFVKGLAMSVDTQQPAPVRFPSPPVASTSSHPADPRLARLPRAPPKKPNPHKPDSALWVMPDGTLAIGAEAKALTRTAVELPLLWARVGDGSRWARREREEGKGKLKVRLDEFRIVIGYGQEGEEGIEVGELGVEPGVFVAAGVSPRASL